MQPALLLLRSAARWLMVVLLLGVFLRSAFVWAYAPGPFSWANLIHAHSHTAYFGWAGLGLMGLILAALPGLTGRPVADSAMLRWLLWLAPWAVGGALLTFAWYGYNGLTIGFATLNEVLWYLFAILFWRSVRHLPLRQWPPALWLVGAAVAFLLLSTLGTLFVIIASVALKGTAPMLYNLGVYLFLHAYGDGWLEVGLMGVIAAQVGGLKSRRLAAIQVGLMLAAMGPAALRLLAPFGLEGPLLTLGAVSGLLLGAAQLLYLANMAGAELPVAARPWWLLAAAALALKALLELVPLFPGWTVLAGERNLVIAFLHLKLLLLVSSGLIGALALRASLGGGAGRLAFGLFALGTAVMVGALVAHGFWAAGNLALGKALYQTAFGAGIVSAAGAGWAVWPAVGLRR